jgi:hypothetical protein
MLSFARPKNRDGVAKPATARPIPDKPCPGITEQDIDNVEGYLKRTGALGGGSRSVFTMEKFRKGFSGLNTKRKQEVLDTQQQEQKWRNDHANLRIFSTDCQKTVADRTPRTLPCSSFTKAEILQADAQKTGSRARELHLYQQAMAKSATWRDLRPQCWLKEIIEQPASLLERLR